MVIVDETETTPNFSLRALESLSGRHRIETNRGAIPRLRSKRLRPALTWFAFHLLSVLLCKAGR
jgi:hypothetical protein